MRRWLRRGATSALPCLLAAALLSSPPAAAQLGGSLSLSSQARFRGRSVSDHRPVAELQLVHDGAGGFYVGGSAALVASRDKGLQPLAFSQYAGFARQISPTTTIDLGVVHSGYTEYSDIAGGGSYTEAYIGLARRHLSARLFLSPGYFRRDEPTLYAEVNGDLDLTPRLLVFAHLGRLTYLRDHADRALGSTTDWRIGLRRRLGPVDLEAAWTGYAQARDHYAASRQKGDAVVAGLSFAF